MQRKKIIKEGQMVKDLKTCDYDWQRDTKYYELTINDLHITKMGHLWIGCVNPVSIMKDVKDNFNKDFDRSTIRRNKLPYEEFSVVVPKRRERVFNLCKQFQSGETYVFKLMKESKSKKYMVSEIFLAK